MKEETKQINTESESETAAKDHREKASKYPLRDIHGQKYLEVKYRIMWFREQHPDWSIQTECLNADSESSLFKATVRDETGRVIATGHKRETAQSFPDFHEKAETGAVGRALALIGFGTQFAIDIDEGERIVDAPAPEPGSTESDTEYRVPFGMYRGRTLAEIDPKKLESYFEYLSRQSKEEKSRLSPQVQIFLEHVRKHLNIEDAA